MKRYKIRHTNWALELRSIAVLLVVTGSTLFFAICIDFGIQYENTENSNSYKLFLIVSAMICLVIFLDDMIRKKRSLPIAAWGLLPIVFLMLINLIFNKPLFGEYDFLLYFMGSSLPGLIAGMVFSKNGTRECMSKYIDVIVIVIVVAICIYESAQYSGEVWRTRGLAGVSYQYVSYASALAFGLNMWSILMADKKCRFSFFKRSGYDIVRTIIGVAMITTALLAGGRGGVVVVLVYMLWLLIVLVKQKSMRSVIGLVSLIGIVLIVQFVQGVDIESFRGLERVITRGDNRTAEVWGPAIDAISKAPIFGYGFGGFSGLIRTAYPHNLFLDIMLCSGVIGLFVFTLVSVACLGRFMKIRNSDYPAGSFIAVIGLEAFVSLMFSGTFLSNTGFWFAIAAIASFQLKSEKENPITAKTYPVDERGNSFIKA